MLVFWQIAKWKIVRGTKRRKEKGDGQPGAQSSHQYGVQRKVYCTQSFFTFARGYFQDLNPWSPDHTAATLQLHQGSPSRKEKGDEKEENKSKI